MCLDGDIYVVRSDAEMGVDRTRIVASADIDTMASRDVPERYVHENQQRQVHPQTNKATHVNPKACAKPSLHSSNHNLIPTTRSGVPPKMRGSVAGCGALMLAHKNERTDAW